MIAGRASFTPSNIQSGFRNTGLVPVNRGLVIEKIQAVSHKSKTDNPSSTNSDHSIPHSGQPSPEPLSTFSIQQLDALQVPQNRVEIERQELIGLATLPRNNLTEWELKKILSNLALCANQGLTEIEEREQQIHNLKQQFVDTQNKRAAKRTRIPTSGKAWVDREDIAPSFESQSSKQCKAIEKKYHHATNLVDLRIKRLAECTRKRKETEKLEEEGKLPKRRRTFS